MASRLKLDQILRELLKTGNVYYQPPESIKLAYPCFVYGRIRSDNRRADNIKYLSFHRYKVTYIDRNPDSLLPDTIEELPYCELTSCYAADGLNHWVYEISIENTKK